MFSQNVGVRYLEVKMIMIEFSTRVALWRERAWRAARSVQCANGHFRLVSDPTVPEERKAAELLDYFYGIPEKLLHFLRHFCFVV